MSDQLLFFRQQFSLFAQLLLTIHQTPLVFLYL